MKTKKSKEFIKRQRAKEHEAEEYRKAMRRGAREEMVQKEQSEYEKLFESEISNEYSYEMLTPYQYRVEGVVDIYPQSQKYHDLKNNVRGSYSGSLLEFFKKNLI